MTLIGVRLANRAYHFSAFEALTIVEPEIGYDHRETSNIDKYSGIPIQVFKYVYVFFGFFYHNMSSCSQASICT